MGKFVTGIALISAMVSACCFDSEHIGPFLVVFLVSMSWLIGYAFINGYFYTE